MKVYSCYVVMDNGACLFERSFTPMPEASLISGMLTAMQSFIQEISGTYAKKLSAGDFVFHLEKIGKISIVLSTDSDNRPIEQMTQLRTRFMNKYGSYLDSWSGTVHQFQPFKEDVDEILDSYGLVERVDPKKPLNAFVLISLKPELQKIAKVLIMKKKMTAHEMAAESEFTPYQCYNYLEELVNLGHVGRTQQDDDYTYFV